MYSSLLDLARVVMDTLVYEDLCSEDKRGFRCDDYGKTRAAMATSPSDPASARDASAGDHLRSSSGHLDVGIGGWGATTPEAADRLAERYGPEPRDRCDIAEVFSADGWTLNDLHAALKPHLYAATPVVIRGGLRALPGGNLLQVR